MTSLPDPGFAGDDGSAPPALATALAAYDADPERLHTPTLAVLQEARLLVPVVALLGESEQQERPDGTTLTHDKTSDMATVLMRGQDGRTALLAFTGTDSLRRWDPQARPVPVTASRAAQAAVQDGAAALVVDVAGPVLFAVEGDDLEQLAREHRLVRLSDRYAWVRPGR
ncbi:MAG: SseB family protein [Nocardioidaceae bacterium]